MIYWSLLYVGILMGLRCSLFADAQWRFRDHLSMAAMHGAVILLLCGLGAGDMHVLTFTGYTLHYSIFFLVGHFAATLLIQAFCRYRMKRRLAVA